MYLSTDINEAAVAKHFSVGRSEASHSPACPLLRPPLPDVAFSLSLGLPNQPSPILGPISWIEHSEGLRPSSLHACPDRRPA